ncbi:pyridoxamine 5'-phosphate oxidase family protein [Haloferacaceae archaeon DSL9]
MSDRLEELDGSEMSAAECRTVLRTHGTGVLALARDGAAYGLPVSFGYADDKLYVVFLRTGAVAKKEEFLDDTRTATMTVYEAPSKTKWMSLIATGTIRRVNDDEWDDLGRAIEDNAWHPSLFSSSDPMRGIEGVVIEIEELTGRRSREYEIETDA